jgi:hypothetical protein
MSVATNPFVDMLWAVVFSCLWVVWLALLFRVMGDIFRRRDLSGRVKTAWSVVAILLPFLGVFAYMASQNNEMTERRIARAAAKEVENAEFLLDIGAITQVEFDAGEAKGAEHEAAMTKIASSVIAGLEPATFWKHFEALTRDRTTFSPWEPAIAHVHLWAPNAASRWSRRGAERSRRSSRSRSWRWSSTWSRST